jgi:hypothetical protein
MQRPQLRLTTNSFLPTSCWVTLAHLHTVPTNDSLFTNSNVFMCTSAKRAAPRSNVLFRLDECSSVSDLFSTYALQLLTRISNLLRVQVFIGMYAECLSASSTSCATISRNTRPNLPAGPFSSNIDDRSHPVHMSMSYVCQINSRYRCIH